MTRRDTPAEVSSAVGGRRPVLHGPQQSSPGPTGAAPGTPAPPTPGAEHVRIEQAIFTSIRSPLGCGYRIIASSPGVGAETSREITRSAPSHGSLIDTSANARALASFRLGCGRWCIYLVCAGGSEYSGRGGHRVHTHALILSMEAFERFHFDPLAVEAAVGDLLAPQRVASPPMQLGALEVAVGDSCAGGPCAADASDARPAGDAGTGGNGDGSGLHGATARYLNMLARVLERRHTLVNAAADPRLALRVILDATPLAARSELFTSYGLRYAPARRFRLIFVNVGAAQAAVTASDAELELQDWTREPAPVWSPFATWLGFVRQHWESGRRDELAALTRGMTSETSPPQLGLVAELIHAVERVGTADADLLEYLWDRFAEVDPQSRVQAHYLARFKQLAETRRSELKQEALQRDAAMRFSAAVVRRSMR